MSFVLDASVTLTWCFEDQQTNYTRAVLALLQTHQVFVPPIWQLEVVNGLLAAERKNLLSHSECLAFLTTLDGFPIQQHDPFHSSIAFLSLGFMYGLSAYDAGYLALASQLNFPLATLDKKIRNAASRAGVQLFQP